jgi:hypothetical protein
VAFVVVDPVEAERLQAKLGDAGEEIMDVRDPAPLDGAELVIHQPVEEGATVQARVIPKAWMIGEVGEPVTVRTLTSIIPKTSGRAAGAA